MSHPADVNFFCKALDILSKEGWEYEVVTRGRENTIGVLRANGFDYKEFGETKFGLIERAVQMILNDWRLLRIAREAKADAFLSFTTPYCAHVAKLMGKPHVAFTDTETASWILRVSVPFITAICSPTVYGRNLGPRHHRFNGFKELAYLHPKYFKPNERSLPEGFEEGRYGIFRINAFDAAHDRGLPASLTLGQWSEIVRSLSADITPVVLSELDLPPDLAKYAMKIPPNAFHDVLNGARLVISDSCTITTESAVLGVPVIFCHPDPRKLMNFKALEQEYGLVTWITDVKKIISTAHELVRDPSRRIELTKRRDRMLAETEDVTEYIVNAVKRWCTPTAGK